MRKIIFSMIFAGIATSLFAQDEGQEKGFKKENLFTGGSITASFYSGGTILGVNPIFGYKLANWVDAGIALNYTYQGSRDNYAINDKVRQHVFGPGAFTRIYPLPFLFLQGQFEHNFSNWTYTDPSGTYKLNEKSDANSLLVGGGWAQGRQRGSNTFFYLCLLFDVLKNPSSPYVNNVLDPSGNVLRTDAIPILRAGVNVALFQGKNKNRYNEEPGPGDGRRHPRSYQGL